MGKPRRLVRGHTSRATSLFLSLSLLRPGPQASISTGLQPQSTRRGQDTPRTLLWNDESRCCECRHSQAANDDCDDGARRQVQWRKRRNKGVVGSRSLRLKIGSLETERGSSTLTTEGPRCKGVGGPRSGLEHDGFGRTDVMGHSETETEQRTVGEAFTPGGAFLILNIFPPFSPFPRLLIPPPPASPPPLPSSQAPLHAYNRLLFFPLPLVFFSNEL